MTVTPIRPKQLANALIVPARLYGLFTAVETVVMAVEIRDDEVCVVDHEGHVHRLHYRGRVIDEPVETEE